jgi:hypothetical protein
VAEEAAEFLRKNGLVAVPANSVPGAGAPAPSPPYVVNPEFVRNCFKTLADGLADWRKRKATLLALKVSGGDKELAKEVGEDFAPPEGCVEVMANALEEICRKYSLLNQWSPEVIFCVAAAVWFLKDQTGMRKLEDMHKERMAADKRAAAPKPAPATP